MTGIGLVSSSTTALRLEDETIVDEVHPKAQRNQSQFEADIDLSFR